MEKIPHLRASPCQILSRECWRPWYLCGPHFWNGDRPVPANIGGCTPHKVSQGAFRTFWSFQSWHLHHNLSSTHSTLHHFNWIGEGKRRREAAYILTPNLRGRLSGRSPDISRQRDGQAGTATWFRPNSNKKQKEEEQGKRNQLKDKQEERCSVE